MNESRWKWIAVLALGMVAGLAMAQVLSVRSVSAQPRQWQECFGSTLYNTSGRRLNSGDVPERVRVPSGWTPIGGDVAGIVFCR